MKTLVHLSDIHFGRVDYAVVEKVIETIASIKPDAIIVSGDLTQRAKTWQFVEARRFLDALPSNAPQIVVPGNHDIPLHNLLDRFARPLDKYRQFITTDLEPFYADDEIAVIGINTARSLTSKYGQISESQIVRVREKMCNLPDQIIKIIVTHHPFDLPAGFADKDLVGRARLAMNQLAGCGADIFLSGHLHLSHISQTAERYKIKGYSALVVQAGTATSTRGRGETNSFNILRIQSPRLAIERLAFEPSASVFALAASQEFEQTAAGWTKVQGT